MCTFYASTEQISGGLKQNRGGVPHSILFLLLVFFRPVHGQALPSIIYNMQVYELVIVISGCMSRSMICSDHLQANRPTHGVSGIKKWLIASLFVFDLDLLAAPSDEMISENPPDMEHGTSKEFELLVRMCVRGHILFGVASE